VAFYVHHALEMAPHTHTHMRLLFVHDRFGALAGAEANLHATAVALKERGHEIGLIHGPRTGRGELEWHQTFSCRWSLEVARPAVVLEHAFGAFEPDAVYVHNTSDVDLLEALVAAGRPLVRMVHDHSLVCMRGCKYRYRSREICRRAFSPYCVFPCGGFLRRNRGGLLPFRWVSYLAKRRELELHRHFQRLLVASTYMKDELVRNGFDPGRIAIHAPVPRDEGSDFQSTFSERNRIVYVGQIVRGKGVDVLLRALAQVPVPFDCVVLGDGHHRPVCERLCRRLGLADRVRFRGFVPQNRLKEFYREASVAVMSSVWPEPFGAAGLEALRCGLPVVAFDAGGIREWLSDGVNGFLVPWMDTGRFAACVTALLRDKALARRLGERGREQVASRFGFHAYVDGLEALFTEVMEEQPCLAVA
jgi:glycosyltransferase involved in cell wall biosynthesis